MAEHPARRALLKLWAPVPWMLEAAIALQLGIGRYAEAGVVTVAAVLAVLVHPVLVAVLLGYVLFALHVVARRWGHDRD